MDLIETTLHKLGIALPSPVAAVANYIPAVRTGQLVYVSGQLCFGADGRIAEAHRGKLGLAVSEAHGREAARLCALNILAQLKFITGDLDQVVQCVRLCGFVNAHVGFTALPQVMNGASDLMVDVFGATGRHSRTTVGVAELPLDAAVEIDAVFEVTGKGRLE